MKWIFFIDGLFREIRIDEWDRQFVKRFTIPDEKLFDMIIVRFNALFVMNDRGYLGSELSRCDEFNESLLSNVYSDD